MPLFALFLFGKILLRQKNDLRRHAYHLNVSLPGRKDRVTTFMFRKLDSLDQTILDTSRTLFMKNGIYTTEMKNIAEQCNIGRSTLYRHFTSKEQIAFYIADEIVEQLFCTDITSQVHHGMSGHEKFSLKLQSDLDYMKKHPEQIRFLDEFDQIFSDEYPNIIESKKYEENMAKVSITRRKPYIFYQEGLDDGSIRKPKDEMLQYLSILHTILGLAQRIIPRKQHFEKEHGYSTQLLDNTLSLLLFSIRNE